MSLTEAEHLFAGLHETGVNKACRRWADSLDKALVVTVEAQMAIPEGLDVLTGQTVFWAITNASEISVTDERLIIPIQQPPAPGTNG